jgi:prepilin-type N-terminal cleavage/methylation domain-containing protein
VRWGAEAREPESREPLARPPAAWVLRCIARPGFSLVELLIVVGIIGLVMAILLPAMGRARESANLTACMSNLRQLAHAMQIYVNDNRGWYPNAANRIPSAADWIYWQEGRRREESPFLKYISPGGAFVDRHFVCPSDDLSTRRGPDPYLFSYTLNARIGGAMISPNVYYPQFRPVRQSRIIRPAQKILMIDENSEGIDDGAWAVYAMEITDGRDHNMLSNRHDKKAERIGDSHYGKGAVIFADCHAAFVDRSWCLLPQYVDPASR